MPGEAARKETQQQQDERRQQQRRQQDQQPQEERRQQQRREGSGMSDAGSSNAGMNRGEMNPDAMPDREGGNKRTEKWQGENSQSGTSQAQKGDSHTPAQQTQRQQQKGRDDASHNFDENRDAGSGENRQATGDQQNTRQTGQTTKGGAPSETHKQEGPYGPPDKHRGPSSPGKPLTDDWGKSDKH